MFVEERRTQILNILNNQGRCLVGDLARELDVTEVTIRQDLIFLERQGLLRRTHGGAMLNQGIGYERPFRDEEPSFKAEKERIAESALSLINEGDTIILDVGTTLTELARKLSSLKKLTVITNSLNIAVILEECPEITTVVTGGTLRSTQHSLVNPFAGLVLERIHADLAFIGVAGIEAEHGLTNVNIPEAEMKAEFIRRARRRVVLADSRKVGKMTMAKVADVTEVDLLITDTKADPAEVERLRDRGLEVRMV